MANSTCSVPECEHPTVARTLCKAHWRAWRNTAAPDEVQRRCPQGPVCNVAECERPAHARGFCSMHYQRWRHHGNPLTALRHKGAPSLAEAFALVMGDTPPAQGCWLWRGTVDKRSGYGVLTHKNRSYRAHVSAFRIFVRPLQPGEIVRHACDVRACVSPGCLSTGSHLDNMRDMTDRGRQVRGVAYPRAKLTDDQVQAMRAAHAAGAKLADLAAEYQVSATLVSRIVRRLNWKHV